MEFIYVVLIILAAFFVKFLLVRGFKNLKTMLKNEKKIYLNARKAKNTTIKIFILVITVISLSGCGTSNGLQNSKFIYHHSHSKVNTVNSNGLYH